METARELLLQELGKLLVVEETLARALLPKLRQEVQDERLGQTLAEHLDQTRGHVAQVRAAFAALGAEPTGHEAKGLDGLKQEREGAIADLAPSLRDGFNASAAMGTEHYEIAAYEAAIRLAEALDETEVAGLLRANLEDEVEALQKLGDHATRLARQGATQPAVA